ncbi:ornithine carbamoyltransferase [Methanohalobium evestigatum Z-7303]|uniref:Ornithine carbamoyltransferase n=1 Tax=Methanohalobium evestigatum (strain ATCC BAA-1072 / DSM 3721 / NBRC 107634 / OCM 161 / Z-7303) TaxID=644295 RepID=D7E8V6_METEZ|nr:ornithine carbamoyltransferase [Methanohalobium evestigatum]ADI73777.1 ornithine carbamoyltransferase [Methanohalobium evestigatum Z-7303]
MKHLISMADLSDEVIHELLDSAQDLKEKRARDKVTELLKNKSLAMIFEKPSTRTRVSFEVAMSDLGGHGLYLNYKDIQLDRGEPISDTAAVLSRYVHGIAGRVNSHDTIKQMAKYSTVPVINALSDMEHPCQILADLLTIQEYKNRTKNLKFAWVGDGNNVCNSAILGCAIVGMDIVVACPEGYEPNSYIVEQGKKIGGNVTITHDPAEAAENADILYTDVWISMGDEEEREKRLNDLGGYQINSNLVNLAKRDVIVMHCLPAHRGEEITEDVLNGSHSVIFDQAENRLHAQKALILKLMGQK